MSGDGPLTSLKTRHTSKPISAAAQKRGMTHPSISFGGPGKLAHERAIPPIVITE
jgi:hypothetical protein